MTLIDYIRDLFIDFDEMGFAPTTLCPDPDAYAIEWRNKITKALEELTEENERLKTANGLFKYLSEAVHWVEIDGKWEMVDFKDKTFAINEMVNKLVNIQNCRANTVRKMQERLKVCFDNEIEHMSIYTEGQVLFVIDQIAKEMLEGEK